MTAPRVRPATPADVDATHETFPDLLPDRWREGGNRRSLVAVDDADRVMGHCRGIDNSLHPGSRVLMLETLPGSPSEVADALVTAQIAVSDANLHLKIIGTQAERLALAERMGAVAIQAMPPWRYVVGPALRSWARQHLQGAEPITNADREDVLTLEAQHYVAQHAGWSPTADVETMRAELTGDHDPTSPSAWDADRSRLLRRDGRIVAAALLWPEADDSAWVADPADVAGGREVTLLTDPLDGPDSVADRAACLAALIDACADGEHLLIDSHLSLAHEQALRASLPPVPGGPEDWTVIAVIPVPGAPVPPPLPASLVPDEAAWIRALCRG